MFGHRVFLRIGELPDTSIMGLFKDAYELLNCSYSFAQGIDQKGQAQTEVVGGVIRVSIPSLPPDAIIRWALNSRKQEKGAIVICDANNQPLEKILFSDAICTGMEIDYLQKGTGYITTQLTIQTPQMILGSITFNRK